MRVAIVHSFYSSKSPSGENVAVEQQADALRDHGVDVKLIAARTDDEQGRPGHLLRSGLRVSTGHGRSPIAEIAAFEPDVVHVHNLFPNWGTSWLDRWDGALVATLHNYRPMCAAGTLFREGATCMKCPDGTSFEAVRHACYKGSRLASIPLAIRNRGGVARDRLLERADRVLLLTERSTEIYTRYGIPAKKVDLVPNFVDDIGFEPAAPIGDSWVYIGRLSEEKGILNLVRHWPDGERLSIYGQGPLESEIRAAASSAVTYHGPLDHAQVPRALARAKGLVFPSEWFEGAPLVYVEALAAGRAVIAKAGSSVADDVAISGSGRVFDAWDDLSSSIGLEVNSLAHLGVQGRAHYERDFTRESWLDNILRVYDAARSHRRVAEGA